MNHLPNLNPYIRPKKVEVLPPELFAPPAWKVWMKRSDKTPWVPVATARTRGEAELSCQSLRRMISTALFDVAFEVPAND